MGQVVIPRCLLAEANKDPGTVGRVHTGDCRVPIMWDGEVVGFYTPHVAAGGDKRIGPVYVRPEWRGRGLVSMVYESIEGPMLACVQGINAESIRLHERCGFVRLRRYSHGWYWRRS